MSCEAPLAHYKREVQFLVDSGSYSIVDLALRNLQKNTVAVKLSLAESTRKNETKSAMLNSWREWIQKLQNVNDVLLGGVRRSCAFRMLRRNAFLRHFFDSFL